MESQRVKRRHLWRREPHEQRGEESCGGHPDQLNGATEENQKGSWSPEDPERVGRVKVSSGLPSAPVRAAFWEDGFWLDGKGSEAGRASGPGRLVGGCDYPWGCSCELGVQGWLGREGGMSRSRGGTVLAQASG